MAARRGWVRGTTAFAALALAVAAGRVGRGGGGGGGGGIPASAGHAGAYVAAHALTLALCPPYAIFFEGGAALVFSAKVLGAVLLDRQELLRSERLLDNHRRNGVLFYTGDHNGVGGKEWYAQAFRWLVMQHCCGVEAMLDSIIVSNISICNLINYTYLGPGLIFLF